MVVARQDQVDHSLDGTRVKEIALRIIVGWRSNDHHVGLAVGRLGVECSVKVQVATRQILFNLVIGYGRLSTIDHLDLLGHDVDSLDMMMLREQA